MKKSIRQISGSDRHQIKAGEFGFLANVYRKVEVGRCQNGTNRSL